MSNPLNPSLYEALERHFERVRIEHAGEAMACHYCPNPNRGFRRELFIDQWGETYCVDCEFCRDSRQRLHINHRFGAWDPKTGATT